jgi:DNA-binding CsgD family transcriptional regulator/PAS domain-containing protein
MVDQDSVSRLITGIYDAALQPELWDSALEAISDALGGAGLNIPFIDSANNARFFLGTARLDPDCGERFLNDPIYVEPASTKWMAGLTASPIGRIFYREELWTDREYRLSPMFNEIIRPQKLWHWAFSPLILENGVFVPLGVLRQPGAPLFDHADAALMTRLPPHLVRALQVSLRLETFRGEAATMEELINRLPIGVILVDDSGCVMQLNRTADAILCEADGLTITRGHLAAETAGEAARLRRLIGEAGRTSRGIGAQPGGVMPLSRPSAKRPLAVLVAPLRSEGGPFETRQARAVVFVSDPERKPHIPAELLARLYRLTPRQAMLMQRLAEGDNLDGAANALGITRNTARTHLRLIFDKTGARRQSELARLFHLLPIDTSPP